MKKVPEFEEDEDFLFVVSIFINRKKKKKKIRKKENEKKRRETRKRAGSGKEELSGERCAIGRVAFVNFVDKTRRVLTARREAPGARPRERAPR